MKLNKVARIKKLLDEITALKAGLAEDIRKLPHNGTAKPLDKEGRCFTVMFSEVVAHSNMSAGYYCFQLQYDALAEYVEKSQNENYVKRLVRVLNKGLVRVHLGCSSLQQVQLHPQVIANVKTLLGGKAHVVKHRGMEFTGAAA